MPVLASLLGQDQAAKLTALQAQLVTEPEPVPDAPEVCTECGQPLPVIVVSTTDPIGVSPGHPASVPAARRPDLPVMRGHVHPGALRRAVLLPGLPAACLPGAEGRMSRPTTCRCCGSATTTRGPLCESCAGERGRHDLLVLGVVRRLFGSLGAEQFTAALRAERLTARRARAKRKRQPEQQPLPVESA